MEETERLEKYKTINELAHSNICTVYRAFDESLNRPVLIKKLHPQMAREDDIRSRFEREAQACAQVKHPNIVDIYGFHVDPENTMLVLEFVEGFSLGELISARKHLTWQIALAILHDVLKGLAYAHSKGVVHRDIKPDNILISEEGVAKVSDFGLATIEDAPRLTKQGMVVGTPAYMPEQINGTGIDQRSDLFSLGATFYEALTGTSPFYAENFSEIMKKILNAYPQKPSVVVKDIPSELDQIILRLLEKHPTRRYASADHALQDVRSLAKQREVSLESEEISQYMILSDTERAEIKISLSTTTTPAPRQRRFSYGWLALIGVIVIVLSLLLPGHYTHVETPPARSSRTLADIKKAFDLKSSHYAQIRKEMADERSVPMVNGDLPVSTDEHRHESILPILHEPGDILPSSETGSETVDQTIPGTVLIYCKPWARVTIDNVDIGETPITDPVELLPGEHQLVLVNDGFPSPVSQTIHVEPGRRQRLDFNLWNHFTVIKIVTVEPWAEIIIDGKSYGYTPRQQEIILPLGTHKIELRNPDCKPFFSTINRERGDPPVEISIALEQLEK